MPSGSQTPLFNWPGGNGETWDAEQKCHVYPTSKHIVQVEDGVQHLVDVEKRVTAVLNAIDYNVGDIHHMIAKDLASPAGEDERALLPETDYYSVRYDSSITDCCKVMLQDKIKRYQRQHAHNLALEDMVDIVLKWDCSAESPQSHRMLPEKEIAYVQIAHQCYYKYLDWNLEHAREHVYENETKPAPGKGHKPCRKHMSVPSPTVTHHGGFYACVIQDLLPHLYNLSEAWTASVEVIVHPKLMTKDEQNEMDAYHAARARFEEAAGLSKALSKVEKQQRAKEKEEFIFKRRHPYPRHELIEWDIHNLLRD